MDTITQIISGLIGVAIVIMIAPRILAVNQGKILQNIAIWVGIALILALIYQTYGPGKLEMQTEKVSATSPSTRSSPASERESPAGEDSSLNEDQGYMPPKEE